MLQMWAGKETVLGKGVVHFQRHRPEQPLFTNLSRNIFNRGEEHGKRTSLIHLKSSLKCTISKRIVVSSCLCAFVVMTRFKQSIIIER